MSKDEILERSLNDLLEALAALHADQNKRPAIGADIAKVAQRESALLTGINQLARARVLLANGEYERTLAEIRPVSREVRTRLIDLKNAVATAQTIGHVLSLIDQMVSLAAALR